MDDISKRTKIQYQNVITEVTQRFNCKKERYYSYISNGRLPKGILQLIIEEVKDEYGVSENINTEIVRSRIKQKNSTVFNASTHSLIETAEKYMAEISIQMAEIKSPLSISAYIQLANSMIEGTSHQEKLVEFKNKKT